MFFVCVCAWKWRITDIYWTCYFRANVLYSQGGFPLFLTLLPLSDRLWRQRERGGACVWTSSQAGPQRGWAHTERRHACTILRPIVSKQKCLPKTQPEMLDPGHRVSYYFTDTRCEAEVSVIKWRVIESYFPLVARCSVAEAVDRFHSCRLGGRVWRIGIKGTAFPL